MIKQYKAIDRVKIKSRLFFIDNIYRNNDFNIKYIELKTFRDKSVEKIYINDNSVIFYRNNIPIHEIKNTQTYSTRELVGIIEHRLTCVLKN